MRNMVSVFFFLFVETKAIGRRSMVGLDLAGDHHEFGQNRARGLYKKLILLGFARPSCIIPKKTNLSVIPF